MYSKRNFQPNFRNLFVPLIFYFFILRFNYPFAQFLVRLFLRLLYDWLMDWLNFSSCHLFVRLLFRSFAYLFIYLFIYICFCVYWSIFCLFVYLCTECKEGEFFDKVSWNCTKCPRNTTQNNKGQIDCKPCQGSNITEEEGTVHETDCIEGNS